VSDGNGVVDYDGFILRGERFFELHVDGAVNGDPEPSLRDPRSDLDGDIERLRPDLGEPEPELLDEVEGEAIPAGWSWCEHRRLELQGLARPNDLGKCRALPVPDDRVAQGIEPVVRELDALTAS